MYMINISITRPTLYVYDKHLYNKTHNYRKDSALQLNLWSVIHAEINESNQTEQNQLKNGDQANTGVMPEFQINLHIPRTI